MLMMIREYLFDLDLGQILAGFHATIDRLERYAIRKATKSSEWKRLSDIAMIDAGRATRIGANLKALIETDTEAHGS